MPKSTTFSNDLLKLIFNGTPIANLADNAASSPLTVLYLSLHTADPGAGGNQATNELSYTGYARVAITRNGTGWTVTNNSVSPTSPILFPEKTGGTGGTATHVVVGTASTGTGKLLYSGALNPAIPATADGTVPQIKTTSVITET